VTDEVYHRLRCNFGFILNAKEHPPLKSEGHPIENLCGKADNKKLYKNIKAPSGSEPDFAKQNAEGECVNS